MWQATRYTAFAVRKGTNIISQKPKAFISLLPQGKNIAANDSFAISLIHTEKESCFFGKYLPFSKYVTHYDTFTILV